MITRLKDLEITGFRSFRASALIGLDANVILIYGKNGSGKSSVMSAIEFGITGQVYDLSRFASDYPRCLRNVHGDSPVEVKLTVTTPNGEGQIIRTLDGRTLNTSGELTFTKAMSRFFVDRCYLSQSRLSRLLELYQAADGDSPEQLLVRFIRELLGLDLLENITAGLYEVADMRRLENACPSLARLNREHSVTEIALSEANRQLEARSTVAANFSADIRNKIESIGDPWPGEKWDLVGMKKRCDTLFANSISEDLGKLQEKQGRINRVAGFLSQSGANLDATARTEQQELLSKQTARRDQLSQNLADGLRFDYEKFPQLATVLRSLPENASLTRRILAAKTTCEHFKTEFEDDTKTKAELERQCGSLRESVESLKSRLKEVEASFASASVEGTRRQLELLRSVVENIHGEDCPVCGRDYSEAGSGGLKEKVRSEIERLGLDIQNFETATKQRNEITDSLNATVRKLEVTTGMLKELEQKLSQLTEAFQNARAVGSFISENEHILNELQSLNDDLTAIQERIKNLDIRIRQNQEVAKESRVVADEIQIPHPDRPAELANLVSFLSREIKNRLDLLEKRRALQQELKEELAKAEVAYRDLEKTQKEIKDNSAKIESIAHKNERIDSHVRAARGLSQAAARAKTKLLNQVFNDTLNTLWRNLYRRLARQEDFVPQLSEPTLNRGKIETHISGTMNGISPFENFASVSSLGNLNTAALSLFLALNLVERPKHQILLLDDPVQNMDDMHVIQFASLLRAIAFQAKRQIVLAVHEKALFDYLALELGPSRDGGSLSLITVAREEGSEGSSVEVEYRKWKADDLRFGT